MDMLERVICGLEHCSVQAVDRDCDTCPIGFGEACALNLKRDALFLLKRQQPQKVTHTATLQRCCTCPSCGNVVDAFEEWGDKTVHIMHSFCVYCGQALNWSEEDAQDE